MGLFHRHSPHQAFHLMIMKSYNITIASQHVYWLYERSTTKPLWPSFYICKSYPHTVNNFLNKLKMCFAWFLTASIALVFNTEIYIQAHLFKIKRAGKWKELQLQYLTASYFFWLQEKAHSKSCRIVPNITNHSDITFRTEHLGS